MSALPQARRSARLQHRPPSPLNITGLQVPPGSGGGRSEKAPSHDDVTEPEAGPEFKVFMGFSFKDDYNIPIHSPFITELLASARNILLQHKDGLHHLATMTFNDSDVNPTPEDLVERTHKITEYLLSHFPIVRFETMGSYYGMTRHPSTLPNYCHDGRPWLARPIDERKTLTLEMSLNIDMLNLFQKSLGTGTDSEHILRFFQHVVIVHELVHVVLFTFSSTPTPVKYHGTHGVPNNNPLSIDRGGDSGPSLEAVMIGGEVALATQAGRGINYVNPEEICAVVRGGDSTGWKVLSLNTPNLTGIATGDWNLINDLPVEPLPSTFGIAPLKMSTYGATSTPAPVSSSLAGLVVHLPQLDPHVMGIGSVW